MRPQRTVGDAELLVATTSDPEAFGTFYRRHERARAGRGPRASAAGHGAPGVSRGLARMRRQLLKEAK